MKVVLFCGGLGTRIREYSEAIPKPMIPVGNRPILWHIMEYYSQYGHQDFILCLGHKAQVIKEFFLNYRPQVFADCVVSKGGSKVDLLAQDHDDWRVSLIDTGVWRSIGERLWAVRHLVQDEDIFFANYSDGLTNANLDEMEATFRASGKVACFLAVRPPISYHLVEVADHGDVYALRSSDEADVWINGGYFLFRREIFDYMREGEDLVQEPFQRLIEDGQLMALKHEGFWRSMDTLKDRQVLEDIIEHGNPPWLLRDASQNPGKSVAVGAP